ncbi:murein biosynthesis integral membrane protein MurJ [Rhizobacter sp. LjRoot28]|uniref:murein biosynthesis integral membrane protein MurJ n=1 Tax=Rhizobacter sp. LjRoot28 TaxID=3342309 RepID=UPI003ECD667A
MSLRGELSGNVRASAWMSVASLAGKGMAVFKTVAIASIFGVSGGLDAFWVAFVIPNILPLFLRSAFVTSFVPFFMRRVSGGDERSLWQAANVLFTGAVGVSVLMAAVLYVWPDWLVHWMAPGLTPEVAATAADLLRITVFSLLFVVAISMLTAIAHCKQRFVAASLESITTNVTAIAAIYLFAQGWGVTALAVGTVLGFALQAAVMAWSCRAELARHIRPSLAFRLPLFREYLGGVAPVLVGALSGIAMGIISQVYLSYLAPGSVSVYQYAAMVAMLPIEIFAGSIQATFFPTIAKYAQGDRSAVIDAHVLAARILVFVLAPVCAVLIALDEHVVRVLFGYGKFSDGAVASTAVVLSCLVLGVIGRALAYFNFQVLHALGRPWAQVIIGFIQLAMNAVFAYVLMQWLGLAGIAIGSSLSLFISVFISYGVLRRLVSPDVVRRAVGPMLLSVALGVLTCGLLWFTVRGLDLHTLGGSRWGYAGLTATFAGLGLLVFFALALLARMKETQFVVDKWRRRFPGRK